MKRKILLTAALIAVASASSASAQHNHAGHNHAMPSQTATAQLANPVAGPHGGSLKQAGGVQLETVVSQGGIRMFVFDQSGQPVSVDQGAGAASLRIEGNAKRYRYDLLPDGKGVLTAPVNLSQLAGRQIEVEVQIVGISATRGQTIAPMKLRPSRQVKSNWLPPPSRVRKSVRSAANRSEAWATLLRSMSTDNVCSCAVPAV